MVAFASAILTLTAFCGGVAPIPLTGIVCYPVAVLLGAISVLFGFRALRQMRESGERGRRLALFGLWSGGLTILVIVLLTVLTVMLLFFGTDAIYSIWPRFVTPQP